MRATVSAFLIAFVSTVAHSQIYSAGYHLPSSTTRRVYVLEGAGTGAWYSVANNSANNLFLPSATPAEWNAFAANLPSGVTLTAIFPQHCKDILGYGISATSGNYVIYPVSPSTPVTAYCEMSDESGGWTRLNASVATSSEIFGANDSITRANIGQICAGTATSVTISSITIPGYTAGRFILTRTTKTIQCPSLSGFAGVSSFYDNSGTWTAANVCVWSPPWASTTTNDLNITGLPLVWKFRGTFSATSTSFKSICSSASDNANFSIQIFVK